MTGRRRYLYPAYIHIFADAEIPTRQTCRSLFLNQFYIGLMNLSREETIINIKMTLTKLAKRVIIE